MWYSSRRLAEAASKRPRKWPSTSKSGRTRPFASCPTGSGMLVKLCSPGEALGVGLRCLSFLDFGLAANAGSIASAIDKSKIDNKQTRSEERRVGKEGRTKGSEYHERIRIQRV